MILHTRGEVCSTPGCVRGSFHRVPHECVGQGPTEKETDVTRRIGAQLGLATNEELMRELICRFRMNTYVQGSTETHQMSVDRALALAEMLGGMSAPDREYRTVDAS